MSFSPPGVPNHKLPQWVTVFFVVTVACLSAALVCAAREYFLQKQSSFPNPVKSRPPVPLVQAVSKLEKNSLPQPPSSKEEAQQQDTQPSLPPKAAPEAKEPPPEKKEDILEVVLTFDDGPHVEEWGRNRNHTEKVVKKLKDNVIHKDIKAVFFAQTHAPGRGGTPTGREIIAAVSKQGHVIGIHTGSFVDHASHRKRVLARPFDVNSNGMIDRGDGANGLESDMIQAKARVLGLTGQIPAALPWTL
jgi:peptidoglycan/xylan/chitin deacetylase (PgdA/CDA1 family)